MHGLKGMNSKLEEEKIDDEETTQGKVEDEATGCTHDVKLSTPEYNLLLEY